MPPAGQADAETPSGVEARAVLTALEQVVWPTAEDVDLLVRNALSLATQGEAGRGQALLRRWRAHGCRAPDLRFAEAIFTVSIPSASAAHRRRAHASDDPETAALEVINCVFRGELQAAIALAEAHGWFRDCFEATEGLTFGLYALALTGRFELAEAIIDDWKNRFAGRAADKYQIMLRIEAAVVSQRHQYARALALLRDAHALCDAVEMPIARAYTEPALAVAHARNDELDVARAILAAWPRHRATEATQSPLEGFRSLARMEIALIEQRWAAALRAADAALGYYRSTSNVPLVCHVRFCRVLAASERQLHRELSAYRRVAYRHQLGLHLRQLGIIDKLVAGGHTSLRGAEVVGRTRLGSERLPLLRLWTPRTDFVGADIYWDRARALFYLGGHGPHTLTGHPVAHRLLDVILSRPDHAVPIPRLYAAVWGGDYNPLRHEGKVHVTVHRLRTWLGMRAAPGEACPLEVQEGRAGFRAEMDIRVVELPEQHAHEQVLRPPLRERLLQCLVDGATLPPRVLERRLGISRSALNQTLRALLAEGQLERLGRGRSTRYCTRNRRQS